MIESDQDQGKIEPEMLANCEGNFIQMMMPWPATSVAMGMEIVAMMRL